MATVTRQEVPPPPPKPVVKITIELSEEEANGLHSLFYGGVSLETLQELKLSELASLLNFELGISLYPPRIDAFQQVAKLKKHCCGEKP